MPTSVHDFPQFSRLPAELRDEIWTYCLPHRVCELDQPAPHIVFWVRGKEWGEGPWPCDLDHTTKMNGGLPLISRVCRESRSVVLKNGIVRKDLLDNQPLEAKWCSGVEADWTWQDRTRDSVHRNWEPGYEADFGSSGSLLHNLAWEASRTSSRKGCLMIEYLDQSFGSPNLFAHIAHFGPPIFVPLSPDKLRDAEALKLLPEWRVVMKVIVVHSDLKSVVEMGLFGLFGDARVQVIDVSEQNRVEEYFSLAEMCERKGSIKVRQDFSRESADSMKQQLRAVVMEQFRCEELAELMRPAIMFRLCTQMCNHVGYEYYSNASRLERYRERYRIEHGGDGRGRCRRVSCCGRRAKAWG